MAKTLKQAYLEKKLVQFGSTLIKCNQRCENLKTDFIDYSQKQIECKLISTFCRLLSFLSYRLHVTSTQWIMNFNEGGPNRKCEHSEPNTSLVQFGFANVNLEYSYGCNIHLFFFVTLNKFPVIKKATENQFSNHIYQP